MVRYDALTKEGPEAEIASDHPDSSDPSERAGDSEGPAQDASTPTGRSIYPKAEAHAQSETSAEEIEDQVLPQRISQAARKATLRLTSTTIGVRGARGCLGGRAGL